jgi:hypothetical protein
MQSISAANAREAVRKERKWRSSFCALLQAAGGAQDDENVSNQLIVSADTLHAVGSYTSNEELPGGTPRW